MNGVSPSRSRNVKIKTILSCYFLGGGGEGKNFIRFISVNNCVFIPLILPIKDINLYLNFIDVKFPVFSKLSLDERT